MMIGDVECRKILSAKAYLVLSLVLVYLGSIVRGCGGTAQTVTADTCGVK